MRFADYGKRVVFAAFDGGEITSDAGVLLLREQARRIHLFERMAGCFTDHRDRERRTHALPALLAQRVCGMALGYEDIIDHDTLRFDPALKLLASPRTGDPGTPAPLAGKSTLNRLEQSWETGNRRYHQMVPNLKILSNLFVTLFLDAHQTSPARITLDIDATDVETHGRQENAFFHGYYEHRCFLPLYVFCGRHLLLAQLRPANIDGARGARNQIRRIVAMIRERWPNVDILLRGDSGFARENLMRWCEGNAVDYVFGLARNDVLLKKAQRVRGKAAMAMIETGQPVRAYGDFHHMTKSRSWARPRRVIAKVEHKPGHEQRCRFLVTSLNPAFLTRIWWYSDSLLTISVLVLIRMGFNKTGCFQDALCGLRQTGGVCRLRRRRDHLGRRCPVTARTGAPDTSVRTHGGLFHRSPGSRTPNPCPSRPVGSTGLRDGARL